MSAYCNPSFQLKQFEKKKKECFAVVTFIQVLRESVNSILGQQC